MDLAKVMKCQNCEVDILESKYPLHESFCIRNIKKCDCGLLVNIVDYDDHFNENHRIVECKFCIIAMENKVYKLHLAVCIERPQTCRYCELEVLMSALKDHEYSCGSKTEQCTSCLKYVQIKDYENHLLHACDPGIRLNSHFNIDKIPFMKKKNKTTKISAVAALMNNTGKKKVPTVDSPFSENFQFETSVNQHPAILNNNHHHYQDKKEKENEKKNTEKCKKKQEKIKFKFIDEDQQNSYKAKVEVQEIKKNSELLLQEAKNEENLESVKPKEKDPKTGIKIKATTDYATKQLEDNVIVKKFPYQRKVSEEVKEETIRKENQNLKEDKPKKNKKKKKIKNEYVDFNEDDHLGVEGESKKKDFKKRKGSDKSDKYSKKKMSHNELDSDFSEVLKEVDKDFYINPKTQEEELLKKVLERSKKEK